MIRLGFTAYPTTNMSKILKHAEKLAASKPQSQLLNEYISKIRQIDLNDDETSSDNLMLDLDILWAALNSETRKKFYEYKQKKNAK